MATSCIQACANDPQVAVHAVRNLVRMGIGVVAVRWSQLGLRPHVLDVAPRRRRRATCSASRTAPTTSRPRTPRRSTEHVWVRRRRRERRVGLDGRRLLPGRPAHPDAHRGLGPHVAARAGGHHRPRPRAAVPRSGSRRSSTRPTSPQRGRTARPRSRQPRTCAWRHDEPARRRAHPASGLQLHRRLRRGRATSTPDCSSSRTCATRARSSSRCSAASRLGRAQRVHRAHGSAVFACPPGLKDGEDWGQALFA